MINETIKNKYIVCKSAEHGKRIIEFFLKNGSGNANLMAGVDIGLHYFVNKYNNICSSYHKPDLPYTEMHLPEEFEPKRGNDTILVTIEKTKDGYSAFYEFGDGNLITTTAVDLPSLFINLNESTVAFLESETITREEAEKQLGKKIVG